MPLRFGVIRQRVVIDAPPSKVYAAYVDAKKHSKFTGATATGRARKGGGFKAWDGYITGKFVDLEDGKRVVQEWQTSEWPEGYPPSTLELVFTKKGSRTELVMTHSRVPAEQVDKYAQGWVESYWNPLKAYFAGEEAEGSST